MNTAQTHLGVRLRAALKDRGLRAADLARMIGVSPQAVNGWLSRGTIRKDYAVAVAKLVGISAEELLAGSDDVGAPALDPEESELVRMYRTLDDRARRGVRLLVDSLAEPAPRYRGPSD